MLQIRKGCDIITVFPRAGESEADAAVRLADVWGGSGVILDGVPLKAEPQNPVLAADLAKDLEKVSHQKVTEDEEGEKVAKKEKSDKSEKGKHK